MNELTLPPPASPLAMDRNPAAVYIASMPSPKSRRSQSQVLNQIAAWLGSDALSLNWSAMQYQHTAAIRAKAIQNYAPATARKYTSALRGVLKHAWRLGLMESDIYFRAVDLDAIEGETLPAGRDLTQGEINSLIYACINDPTAAGVRDAALISMMYVCLVRISSLVALKLSDYDPNTGRLVWHGKRQKAYTAYVSNGSKASLDDWLTLRGSEPGPMFYPISQTGAIERTAAHLSDHSIYVICQKRAKESGVAHFSPHDFRRTGVGDLLDRGVDLITVSKIASHDDPKTTGRYDRRPEEIKRAAAQKLHVPYTSRTAT